MFPPLHELPELVGPTRGAVHTGLAIFLPGTCLSIPCSIIKDRVTLGNQGEPRTWIAEMGRRRRQRRKEEETPLLLGWGSDSSSCPMEAPLQPSPAEALWASVFSMLEVWRSGLGMNPSSPLSAPVSQAVIYLIQNCRGFFGKC